MSRWAALLVETQREPRGPFERRTHVDATRYTICNTCVYNSFLRLIDSCITQLKAQGPSRTCNESKEEEEDLRLQLVSNGAGVNIKLRVHHAHPCTWHAPLYRLWGVLAIGNPMQCSVKKCSSLSKDAKTDRSAPRTKLEFPHPNALCVGRPGFSP